MTAMRITDLFDLTTLPAALPIPAGTLDFGAVHVTHYSLVQTPFGPTFMADLALESELGFQPPGLPVRFVLAGSPLDPLRVRAGLSEDWFVEIYGLGIAARFDPLILRPLDSTQPFAEIRAETGIRIAPDGISPLEPDLRLSLPPSEIPNTGIVIALDDLLFDFFSDFTPEEIAALGYGPDFQGIFAREAQLRFLPKVLFGQTFGLTLTAEGVAISANGVTCKLDADFLLDVSATDILPESTVRGELFSPEWAFGLRSVKAEIFDNTPLSFAAEGAVRVPILDQVFALTFGMEREAASENYRYTAAIESEGAARIQTPFGDLRFDSLKLSGALEDGGFELSGDIDGLDIDLAPLVLTVGSVFGQIKHSPAGDELRATLTDVALGPLGTVSLAELILRQQSISGGVSREVSLETAITWGDFAQRLNLPDYFPVPRDDEAGSAKLTWAQDSATGQTQLHLKLSATVRDLDRFWRFIPANLRPQLLEAQFTFEATYTSPAQFSAATSSSAINGSVGADLKFRLPAFPADPFGVFTITTGGSGGILQAHLAFQIDAQGNPGMEMSLTDLIGVEVNLPGLPQPQPPIALSLNHVGFDLQGSTDLEGTLTATGGFTLRPILPPPSPISQHLQRMLAQVGLDQVEGTSTLKLAFKDGRAAIMLECQFVDAEIEMDIFDTLAGLTRGLPAPESAMDAKGEIDLDLEIGFGLTGVRLQLGSLDPAASATSLHFEITMMMRLGDLRVDGFLRFTDAELVIGIGAMEIPLLLPPFPLALADLDRIRAVPGDPASQWTDARWQAEITAAAAIINQLAGSAAPADRKALAKAQGQKFLLESIYAIYSRMSGTPNRQAYQAGVELIVGAMELTTGRAGLHQDSNIKLKLSGAELVIPFEDPRGIAVQGSASLIGFANDDPLKPLEGVTLTLGISSDQIYFALESAGTPIPLPDFGRYPGGSVSLSRFSIGFGYTKRSLAIAFAGELVLPPQLVADADTSQIIGFGIRLPRYTRLGFRLDIIPIPGPIPVVPAFEFNLDMNSPGTQGITATEICEPFWDGFQLIIPGVIHAGFKKLAYSPLFGILPIHNVTFDGDLVLGDENNGLTLVVDNMVITTPLGLTVPIPMLAYPGDPWVDNLCFNLRIAGFGINFNYRRPLPDFNPLSIFEILGLLADPMMPIDPDGALANILLIALEDAYITIPSIILRLFPDLKDINRKPLNILVNLGTLISATQAIGAFLKTVWQALAQAGNDFAGLLDDLARNPPQLSAGALLSALPPELRKLRTGGSLAGFEATVVLLLIAPDDARVEFQRRDTAPQLPAASSQPLHTAAAPLNPDRLANHPLNLPAGSSGRIHHPADPESNLFKGIEFEAFSAADVGEIPAPRKPMAGVVLGAHVKLPNGQRFRFLGYLFEDGSFGLISALEIDPLQLTVAGIALTIPLELDARLVLQGRAKRDGFYGSITARGHARWKFIPGIAELQIASRAKPAALELYSDGRFRASADGKLILFNGSAVVDGSVDLSETHCFVEGRLRYNIAPIEIDLVCSGRIGPGPHYALTGAGTLKILGHPFSSARGMISEDRAEFEARLNTGQWRVGGVDIPCSLDLAVRGAVNLQRRTNPEFAFEGRGAIAIFGAQIEGRAGIIRKNGSLKTFAEGAVLWHGRRWLDGRIEIGTQRVAIGGRTSFTLDLTPSNIAGVDLAHLYFKCDLQGEFSLDQQNGLAGFSISGDWSLGARGAGGDQVFPLAAQQFALNGQTALELQLIHVKNMALLPFDDVTIPVPTLKSKTPPPPVRFGFINNNMAFSWNGTALELGIPPWVHGRNLYNSETTGKVYFNYELSFEDQTLTLPLSGDFILSLVWRSSRLALKIARGSAVEYWNL